MKHLSAIVFSLVLLLASSWAWASPVALNFAPKAKVSGARISLLDLVKNSQDLPQEVRKRLKAQTVAPAPAKGHITRVDAGKLRSLLRQAKLPKGSSVMIPAKIQVERATIIVTSQRLAEMYKEALIRHLGHRADDADIHSISSSREVKLPAGRLSHTVRFMGSRPAGRVPANITLSVDGRRLAQVRVTGQVDLYQDVAVAVHSLPRRHVIQPGDLKTMRINVSGLKSEAATSPKDLVGLRVKSNLGAGSPIRLNQLERAPLVHRGDVVTMICTGPGMRITAKGKVEQTGYKNSRIRLTNLASNREVYGTVLDSGTVRVRF